MLPIATSSINNPYTHRSIKNNEKTCNTKCYTFSFRTLVLLFLILITIIYYFIHSQYILKHEIPYQNHSVNNANDIKSSRLRRHKVDTIEKVNIKNNLDIDKVKLDLNKNNPEEILNNNDIVSTKENINNENDHKVNNPIIQQNHIDNEIEHAKHILILEKSEKQSILPTTNIKTEEIITNNRVHENTIINPLKDQQVVLPLKQSSDHIIISLNLTQPLDKTFKPTIHNPIVPIMKPSDHNNIPPLNNPQYHNLPPLNPPPNQLLLLKTIQDTIYYPTFTPTKDPQLQLKLVPKLIETKIKSLEPYIDKDKMLVNKPMKIPSSYDLPDKVVKQVLNQNNHLHNNRNNSNHKDSEPNNSYNLDKNHQLNNNNNNKQNQFNEIKLKINYCNGNIDPFQSQPVDNFIIPTLAPYDVAYQWKNELKNILKKISLLKIGGNELREIIKNEVDHLKLLRFKLFCNYVE